MTADKQILDLLRSGSTEDLGKVLTDLVRLKDPAYKEELKKLMKSGAPYLSVMAAYALGESGDGAGMEFIQQIMQNALAAFKPLGNMQAGLKVVEEVRRLLDTLDYGLSSYKRSDFIHAREKLAEVLKVFSNEIPKQNVPHFDMLLSFSIKKTRGLLLDARAMCEFSLGNIEEALQYNMEAVTLGQEIGDPQLLKIAYGDLGHIHISLGNYYSALELLHQSLEIDDTSHDPWRKRNRTVCNLARLYYVVGLTDKAIEFAQEALELAETEKDNYGKARALNAAGVFLTSFDEFEEAEECLQEALKLTKDELNDVAFQGLVLNNLAFLCHSKDDVATTKKLLGEALALASKMADKSLEVITLTSMAIVEVEEGNAAAAEQLAGTALIISQEIEDPSGQVDALWILGSMAGQSHDDNEKAYSLYKEAIGLSEGMRNNLMLDDFKMSFAGNHINLYQQMVALCIRMGKTEEAFQHIERSKSRALVDMLAGSTNNINAKAVSEDKQQKLENLKAKLLILKNQLSTAHASDALNNDSYDRASAIEELQDLEHEYERTFDELRTQDPRWTSLVSVDVADIKTVQGILDEDSLLLEFYQAGNETIIMAMGKDGLLTVHCLTIDPQEEADRVYSLFEAVSDGKNADTRSHEYIKNIKQPLTYFYDLLVAPLSERLMGIKHIVFVLHQFWHYLPCQALYDKAGKKYLSDRFSISYAPSATSLVFCRKKDKRAYKSAFVLANPSGDLKYAEEEGKSIADKFDTADMFVRGYATFRQIQKYSNYDVIHLACHGYFRCDAPLFSHLVLSDTEGESTPVYLADIFNLKLETSLVTLSACDTGVNRLTIGDELIGLSRAFLYAGSPSIVSTLWAVNDRSTALLMNRFYDGVVRFGESKAEALRQAALVLKTNPAYGHPWYWASFCLTGGWV